MRVIPIRALVVLSILAVCSLPAAAQKVKAPGVPDLPYWTLKGRPARQFVPGLNAALLLSAEQKQSLATAWQETVGSEAVASAARMVKTNPNVTSAQRQAALETYSTAMERLRQSIQTILTPEQKALIAKITDLFVQIQGDTADQFQAELAGAKGDKEQTDRIRQEMRAKAEGVFIRRLESVLTPGQREAMQQAAGEEIRAAAEGARAKSGK